uniref:RNA-directed DNA polymerase n=1 Tax=Strongyloides venezuelensis TaxID=75913 RepID=A0A0K0FNQ4_STRVS
MELVENKNGILNIDFKKHQMNDKEIREAIETGMYGGKKISIVNDIVYVKTKQSRKGQELRKIIPTSLYDKILCLAHMMREHFDLAKTKHLIKEVGYVKSINSIINQYISECDECLRRNSPTILHPKINHVNQYTMPFQNQADDICGPIIPTSTTGNKYLLVFVYSFSRYTIIIPCRSYSFNEIFQRIMDEIIWKHGNLLSIRTDDGSNFKG